MNIVAIIQARTGSTRLPNKIFSLLCEKPLIWHIVKRVNISKLVNKVVVATSTNKNDDTIEEWCSKEKIFCYRGDEQNVLSRYFYAAKAINADIIIRITCDDPFKDPVIMDEVIKKFLSEQFDFVSNNNPPSFPEGLDIEVFTMNALETAFLNTKDAFEQEHVTQFFLKNPTRFKIGNLKYKEDISQIRLTVDTTNDLQMTKEVYNKLYQPGKIFLLADILDFFTKNPEISQINSHEKRSTLYLKS